MKKGDIVLIPFPISNLKGIKKRPAVVLYADKMDILVAFITTKLQWKKETDILLEPDEINRLKKPSLLRLSKMATLELGLTIGKVGSLKKKTLKHLDSKLKIILDLN